MDVPSSGPIAVVSHLYPHRGRESYGMFVAEQVRALTEVGAEVGPLIVPVPFAPWPLSAVSPKWASYASAERTRTDFDTVRVSFPRYLSFPRKLWRSYSASTAARAVMRDEPTMSALREARVIVAHTALLDGQIAQALSRATGVPYVVFIHGEDLYQNTRGKDSRYAATVGGVLTEARTVIAVSEAVAGGLRGAFPDLGDIPVLPNGVDTELFAPSEHPAQGTGALRILTAAHLVERKAHRYVLSAAATLIAEGLDVAYTIAGDGPERANVATEVERLGLRDAVSMPGAYRHQELPALLAETDLFVLPSWDEAFGVVYLESLACGVPAIAANDEGAKTIISDGVDGYLVPPRDSAAVASAVRRFALLDPAARDAMRRAAREKALTYTWTSNATGLLAVLDQALP